MMHFLLRENLKYHTAFEAVTGGKLTYLSIYILTFTVWYGIFQVCTQVLVKINVHWAYGLAYLT